MKQITLLLFVMLYSISNNVYGQSTDVNSANYSPLHWAASQGYVEMLKVLVDKGYDVNLQDANGFTPLHYAAASGSFNGVQFLIDRGANVYLVNKKNITPMSLAAQAGEQKIVDYLFIKMRSTKINQLQANAEKERVNTDLVQAAKARSEAERLRQQASEWTKEAEYWRTEAEKWTREANGLKERQVQIDQLAKDRYDQIILEKLSAESNYNNERLARNAAERLLKEQNASTKAQIRAYEAQVASLAAQKATDVAIDNLAEEFLRRGVSPGVYNANTTMPIDVITQKPIPKGNYSIELESIPILGGPIQNVTDVNNPTPKVVVTPMTEPINETENITDDAVTSTEEEAVVEEAVVEEAVVEEVVAEEAVVEYATEEYATEEYATEEVAVEETTEEYSYEY